MKRVIATAAAAICGTALLAPVAGAHQSPSGCSAGTVHLSFTGNETIKRDGDVVPITARVDNVGANGCDITDATVQLQFPNPDGTFNGQTVTLAQHLDLPAGTPTMTFPAVNFTPSFDPAVFRGIITLSISGVQHFGNPDNPPGFIASVGSNIVVSKPHATVTVTPSPAGGDTPLSVTYGYSVLNDSAHDSNSGAVDPGIFPVSLSDDTCSSPAFTGGDTSPNDGILTRGETWTYSCMTTLFGGTYTNHVTVDGTSTRDGRPWPTATAQSTVTVNGPDMTLAKSHTGTFTQGDTGRAYTITATNGGNRGSTGPVTVTDVLPVGVTATSISGSGWSCTLGTLSCTRSDPLAGGQSYAPIAVTVDVAADAPSTVTNNATLSRANENSANNSASDPTAIAVLQRTEPAQQDTEPPENHDQPADRLAPAFLALRLEHTAFAVDRAGPPETVVAAKARGTTFDYTLSEPARVVFAIDLKAAGRRVGRTCRKPSRSNRRKRPCTRFVRQGAFAQNSATGANARRWSGKIGAKPLAVGSYRATLAATDAAGNVSISKQLNFRIIRF